MCFLGRAQHNIASVVVVVVVVVVVSRTDRMHQIAEMQRSIACHYSWQVLQLAGQLELSSGKPRWKSLFETRGQRGQHAPAIREPPAQHELTNTDVEAILPYKQPTLTQPSEDFSCM
jgi:hypothetical protein